MSRSSTTIAITRESHLSAIIQSFSTNFIILFSKFKDSIDVVHIIYYSPIDIEHGRVTNNLRILSICIRNQLPQDGVKAKVSTSLWRTTPKPSKKRTIVDGVRFRGAGMGACVGETIWQFVRLYSPVLDSNVLSGYLSLNTKTKTFIQMLRHQLRHYPVRQSNPPVEMVDSHYNSNSNCNSDFITGITLTLKGRIQTESIKPRKTVQSFIVGSHYSTRNQTLVSNSSSVTNSNYELGSYSISVKVTGITDGQHLDFSLKLVQFSPQKWDWMVL